MQNIISVVVCTYNQEKTIGRALDSILRQQCRWQVEIIVGDDHSEDNTLAVCREYERRTGGAVRVIEHTENQGILGNYVDCLMQCRGKYIADLAGDDEWADDGKLQMELDYLESHPDTVIVHTDYLLRDEETGRITMPPRYPLGREPYGGRRFVADMMGQDVRPAVHFCTAMYRNDVWRACREEWPGFFKAGQYPCEDVQLAALMAMKGKVAYIDKVTLYYTVGAKSISHNLSYERHYRLVRDCIRLLMNLTESLGINNRRVMENIRMVTGVMLADALRTGKKTLGAEAVAFVREREIRTGWKGCVLRALMAVPLTWKVMERLTGRKIKERDSRKDSCASEAASRASEAAPEAASCASEKTSCAEKKTEKARQDRGGENRRKRKVAFVMETMALKGGLERVMADRMNALAARGWEVLLIEVYDGGGREDAYCIDERVRRVALGVRKRGWRMKPWQFCKAARMVAGVIDRERPEVMTSSALLGVMLYGLRSYNTRMIYESHGPRRFMPLKFMVRRMERTVDMVVALTEGDAAEYRTARRKTVVPNYLTVRVDGAGLRNDDGQEDEATAPCIYNKDEEICNKDKEKRHNNKEKKPGEGKRVVALGRMSKEKDYALLVKAWRRVVGEVPEARLDIYGDGSGRAEIESETVRQGVAESVTLHHAVSDVGSVYRDADIVAVTSRFEGFPMVALEAIAHGVAVVAADVDYGPREILQEGSGLLTERTPEAVAEGIVCMMKNPKIRARMGCCGMKRAAKYDREEIVSRWESVFSE